MNKEKIEQIIENHNCEASSLIQILLDIQNELNHFQEESVVYNSTVQKALAQAQIDESRAVEVVRTNIQSYGAQIQAAVSNYQVELQQLVQRVETDRAQVAIMQQQFNQMLAPYLPAPTPQQGG